jgi:single-strand DNA-binding protein
MQLNNQVNLTGNITRDVELRYSKNGKSFARILLAINRGFGKDSKGADFLPIVIWGKQAENAAKFLVKGSKVSIMGHLRGTFFETTGADGKAKSRLDVEVVADQVQYLSKPNQGAEPGATRGRAAKAS